MNTDQYYETFPANERPVFDQSVGGFIIWKYPHLGVFPRSYGHAVQALARSPGVYLQDDENAQNRPLP